MDQSCYDWFSLDNALEIIFSFGTSGTVTYANQAAKEMLDYGEELCGTSITAIMPNDFLISEHGFETELELEKKQHNVMVYRKNRTCFPAVMRCIKNREHPDLYICMMQDISKQEFLEKEIVKIDQEAEDAMKVKSEFVANVTHELRTPVNGILGNTKDLLEMEDDKDKLKILHLIERGCREMNGIINNILDFSKLEAGKFSLDNQKFNFRNMIDYIKSNHINRITEKGLTFFVTISPEVPEYIIGDELRIVQILNNLLSNALKFTAMGKIVLEVVKTAQVNNRAEMFFLVMDTGIGIDKSEQDKLFKSFSQVDASISRKYGGTGLGLNICKQLVELMGGHIDVESEKNKGSMFSFSIWVELPEDEIGSQGSTVDVHTAILQARTMQEESDGANAQEFGTTENLDEIRNKLSKLILCVEMENWEKAEMFIEVIKQLTEAAPKEIKTAVLKLKMAVQRENYDKTTAAFEALNERLGFGEEKHE